MIWTVRESEARTSSLPAAMPPVRLEFVYDYMSRRCVKRLYDKSGEGAAAVGGSAIVEGSAAAVVQSDEEPVAPENAGAGGVVIPVGWTLSSTFKFVWDGWNLLAELDGEDGVLRTCAWGLDLSGSEQGAGGVGGLLFEYLAKTDTAHHLFYDGNGNVTSLRDDGGALSCEYAYGPFGETLTARGDEGALAYNTFKFSTKYTDAESGLLYYGYRYYNPGTGRWLNRDPIAEIGCVNVLAFVSNSPQASYDILGLDEPKIGTDDPPVTPDRGAGRYASDNPTLIMAAWYYELHSITTLLSGMWPDASRHLQHYLGNSGQTLTIRADRMVQESAGAKNHYLLEKTVFINYVDGLCIGNHDVTSGRIAPGAYNNKSDSQNWFFAVGGYAGWGKGHADITCGENGKKHYRFEFRYMVYDRYNWDAGKSVTVFGVPITDDLMGRLHREGYAREFDMRGEVVDVLEWDEGEKPNVWRTSSPPTPATAPGRRGTPGRDDRERGPR